MSNGKALENDNKDAPDRDDRSIIQHADPGPESEAWVEIYNDRNYTPTAEDVGRCLRVECQALSMNGDVITGPKQLFTETVLSCKFLRWFTCLIS